VTAQDRSAAGELTGFSFVGCSLTGSGTIYLGRAWGTYSRVVFIRCSITEKIIPAGWFDWDDATRQKTVFYGEYECTGVGANRTGRVKWSRVLTAKQAAAFSNLNFIDGQMWLGISESR
jgi:pectinesterase